LARNICGIIIAETRSAEEAMKRAETMRNCPYLMLSGTTSNIVYFVSVVPEEKKWWLKYPETNPPEGIATGKLQVHMIENIAHPVNLCPKLPREIVEKAPCGADCRTCRLREKYDCDGCPATVHWKLTRVSTSERQPSQNAVTS